MSNTKEIEKEDFIRKICDKDTSGAIDMLKLVNEEKYKRVQDIVLGYYDSTKQPISYSVYCQLLEKSYTKKEVFVHRKNNMYDLEDINDSDDLYI